MNREQLIAIVDHVTQPVRKGAPVVVDGHEATPEELAALAKQELGGVIEFFGMPAEQELLHPEALEIVDLHFIKVAVHKAAAEAARTDLVALLNTWDAYPSLKEGPSYIAVGAALGSQEHALRLFAAGVVLGLWKLITPAMLGVLETNPLYDAMVGNGLLMIDGYHPNQE